MTWALLSLRYGKRDHNEADGAWSCEPQNGNQSAKLMMENLVVLLLMSGAGYRYLHYSR
ncbi:hypothetical protein MPH_13840, partial [Macrophomina phaseolina MS6]